jgi:hypothetical protein
MWCHFGNPRIGSASDTPFSTAGSRVVAMANVFNAIVQLDKQGNSLKDTC